MVEVYKPYTFTLPLVVGQHLNAPDRTIWSKYFIHCKLGCVWIKVFDVETSRGALGIDYRRLELCVGVDVLNGLAGGWVDVSGRGVLGNAGHGGGVGHGGAGGGHG